MNHVVLIGRICNDPDIRYTQGDSAMCIASYRLAVDRRSKKQDGADFISIKAFGKSGEFAEKYLHKGMKIAIAGRIQTGSYTNKNGQTVYTTDVIAQDQEFCESKGNTHPSNSNAAESVSAAATGGLNSSADQFVDVLDEIAEELPFT